MSYLSVVDSVQTGARRALPDGGGARHSGIYKTPKDSIDVLRSGVRDDHTEADYHGGDGQAVYVYGSDDYSFFADELGRELGPGLFGENVTVAESPPHAQVGDRLVFEGGVVLEITGPRTPCATFAVKMRDVVGPDTARGWVKRFKAARRFGVYCRVIEEGRLRPGLGLRREPAPADNIYVLELADLYDASQPDPSLVKRALHSPVDARIARWLSAL